MLFQPFSECGAIGSELIDLPCDSLVAPTILSSAAKGSALMVFMHEEFMKLPVFVQLREKLQRNAQSNCLRVVGAWDRGVAGFPAVGLPVVGGP